MSKFRKYLKKLALSLLGGGLALALGLLLLVPEAQSGETYVRCALRPQKRETGGRKKMNHGNRTVMRVNRYDTQRRTYGPTDVMKRQERTLGEKSTNIILRISDDGRTQRFVRVTHKPKKETPSGVNRVGRKGKKDKKRREAIERLKNDGKDKGFRKTSTSSNDVDAVSWQVAAPPAGEVQTTVSAPRAAAGGERQAAEQERSRARRNAVKIKESQRINSTNALPRALRPRRNALSADGDAKTTD